MGCYRLPSAPPLHRADAVMPISSAFAPHGLLPLAICSSSASSRRRLLSRFNDFAPPLAPVPLHRPTPRPQLLCSFTTASPLAAAAFPAASAWRSSSQLPLMPAPREARALCVLRGARRRFGTSSPSSHGATLLPPAPPLLPTPPPPLPTPPPPSMGDACAGWRREGAEGVTAAGLLRRCARSGLAAAAVALTGAAAAVGAARGLAGGSTSSVEGLAAQHRASEAAMGKVARRHVLVERRRSQHVTPASSSTLAVSPTAIGPRPPRLAAPSMRECCGERAMGPVGGGGGGGGGGGEKGGAAGRGGSGGGGEGCGAVNGLGGGSGGGSDGKGSGGGNGSGDSDGRGGGRGDRGVGGDGGGRRG